VPKGGGIEAGDDAREDVGRGLAMAIADQRALLASCHHRPEKGRAGRAAAHDLVAFQQEAVGDEKQSGVHRTRPTMAGARSVKLRRYRYDLETNGTKYVVAPFLGHCVAGRAVS
jgi:hypothetical protein